MVCLFLQSEQTGTTTWALWLWLTSSTVYPSLDWVCWQNQQVKSVLVIVSFSYRFTLLSIHSRINSFLILARCVFQYPAHQWLFQIRDRITLKKLQHNHKYCLKQCPSYTTQRAKDLIKSWDNCKKITTCNSLSQTSVNINAFFITKLPKIDWEATSYFLFFRGVIGAPRCFKPHDK